MLLNAAKYACILGIRTTQEYFSALSTGALTGSDFNHKDIFRIKSYLNKSFVI
jgi:hypothetical protein